MTSLADRDGELSLIVTVSETLTYQFTFGICPAYRNTLEEFCLGLWDHLKNNYPDCGNTFIVNNSPWLRDLRHNECLIDVHCPGAKHFVIVTGDDVIEILSNEEPAITMI